MKQVILFVTLLVALIVPVYANSAPVVSNVTASQRIDGSGIVDIYYTLSDADNDRCTVGIEVSDDGGSSWDVSVTALSGDIGENISPGRRHITWDSKTDLPGEYGTNYRVKVTADDGIVDIIPIPITWVYIDDPGGFNGQMSKYEMTNAQYCQFFNAALASGDIIVSSNLVYGANGSNGGADFAGQVYYDLAGPGHTRSGATNGGAARINYSGGVFTVDSGFENHPVTYVSWYGATAFCNYYGYRLPTQWEWQAVADYDGSYIYGCGMSINNSIANYLNSTHPNGTTIVGSFGTYGYGMCDMAGNVWEWTSSVWDKYRVIRGGAWYAPDNFSTVSYRLINYPFARDGSMGFRVCR